jgi:uncharacterized membrane protein YhaH (DUF805 family)
MEWMLLPLRRYADFKGRSRRKEYWMFALLLIVIYSVLMVPLMMGGMAAAMAGDQGPGALFYGGVVLVMIFGLAVLVPSIAVQVRRFHDQDRSGWMVLIGLIPYVGGLILLVFMCLEGTRGPNRFGPDPKDPMHQDVFG